MPTEYEECKTFYKWASLHPICKDYLIHHVNEGKRSMIAGVRLKAIGMRAGVPDYQLPVANKQWHGLWIEMKLIDGQKKTKRESQDNWIAKLLNVGQYATYAYGAEDAISIVTDYLNNRI